MCNIYYNTNIKILNMNMHSVCIYTLCMYSNFSKRANKIILNF